MDRAARIRVLPADVVNRIAAGEVVERPASVVKELVENSLDAETTRVEVEIREGGRALIRVSDDGYGMSPGDLERAFLPHSTSKLSDVDDLLHIGTLGFRGEALASIGAVARATITSRQQGGEGHSVENDFGRIGSVAPAACPTGTMVEVSDLFQRVPARKKFLKSSTAELARITELVQHFGICHPEIEFRLNHAGRLNAHFPLGMSRKDRIARAYGRELRDSLIETEASGEGVHLLALLAPPSLTRADSTRMLYFLNGRRVRDKTLLHAGRQAYQDLIFGPRSPVFFVFLTMDPALVDQNVHPMKVEVRFRDAGAVHALVRRSMRRALTGSDLAHRVPLPGGGGDDRREERIREAVGDYLARAGGEGSKAELFSPGPPGGGRSRAGGDIGKATDFLQVRDTYIVLETGDGISVLDQHALHERVLYDQVRRRYVQGDVEAQRFLRPVVVDLDPVERDLLLDAGEALRSVGFVVEAFGPASVVVRGVPVPVAEADPEDLLEEVLLRLRAGDASEREQLVEGVLAGIACRAAVKAGDRLGREQVADLLAEAEKLTHSHTCPHGRPTALRISYGDLERHFKRK